MPSYDADINIDVGTDLDINSLSKTATKLENEFNRMFDSAVGKKTSARFKQLEIQASRSLGRMKALVDEINNIQFNSEPSEEVKYFTNRLKELKDEFAETKKSLEEKIKIGASTTEIEGLKNKLASIKVSAKEAGDGLENAFANQIQDTVIKTMPLAEELRDVENNLVITKSRMEAAGGSTKSLRDHFRSLSIAFSRVRNGIKNVVPKFKELHKHTNKSGSSIRNFIKAALGIGLLLTFFNKLRRAIFDGFKNLAEFSPNFKATVSDFKNSLTTLKNSIGAAFAPIASVVLPILTALIDKVNTAVEALGRLIATLMGKKTYTRAVKNVGSVGDAVAGANSQAQELQKTLAGFDDVEILNSNKDSGSGGGSSSGSGVSSMFEEASLDSEFNKLAEMIKDAWKKADFTEIGTMIGAKLKDALDSIPWDSIKDTMRKVAKSIATLLNGFLETPGLFDSIGKTIAEAINSAVEFLYEFASNLHWDSVGTALGDGLNGAIANLDWIKLGITIGEWVSGLLSLFVNWITKTDWYEFGSSLGRMITSAIQNTEWSNFGAAVAGALNALVQFIKGAVENTSFTDLAHGIADAIITFFAKTDWSEFGTTLLEVFEALGTFFATLADDLDLAGLGKAMMEDLWDGITKHAGLQLIWWQTAFPAKLYNAIADGLNSIIPKLNKVINKILDPLDLLPDVEIPLVAKIKDPELIYKAAKATLEDSSKKSNIELWAEGLINKTEDRRTESQKQLSTKAAINEHLDLRKNKSIDTTAKLTGPTAGTKQVKDVFGSSFNVKSNLTGAATGTKQVKDVFGSVFNVQSNLTGKTVDSKTPTTIFGTVFNVLSKLTGKTTDSKTTNQIFGSSFNVVSKLTGAAYGTKWVPDIFGSVFTVLSKLNGAAWGTKWVPDVFGSSFNVLSKLTGAAWGTRWVPDVFGSVFNVLSKLTGAAWGTRWVPDIFGSTFSVLTKLTGAAWGTLWLNDVFGTVFNVQARLVGAVNSIRSVFGFANGGVITARGLIQSIPQYAGGTTNAHGSMFIAGESGPEVVGHINGRTEILNKSQIASAIYSAVKTAMLVGMNQLRSIIPVPIPINIDVESLGIPDIVRGFIVPYDTRLTVMEDMIANQNPDPVTSEDLRGMIDDVIAAVNKVQFYIGDEQIARHSQLGNQKLDRRYNPVVQGA